MKTKKILTILGIVLVVLFLVLWFFGVFSRLMTIGASPLQTKTVNFAGTTVIATAPLFGSISNYPTKLYAVINHPNDGIAFPPGDPFCGGASDGNAQIEDIFTGGNTLTLNSGLSSNGARCGGNTIEAKMTLPAGTLTGICTTSAKENEHGADAPSKGICSIRGITVQSVYDGECARAAGCIGKTGTTLSSCLLSANMNEGFFGGNCVPSKSGKINIVLDKPTKITMKVSTYVGYTGNSRAKMTLNFEEFVEPLPKCGDGEVNQDSEICDDGNLINDDECDNKCQIVEPIPPISPFKQFFINIWDWVRGLFGK